MPKIVSDEVKAKIAEWYLKDGQTIESTARRFNINYKTVRKYLAEVEDKSLTAKIKSKLGMYGQNGFKQRHQPKNVWATLDKTKMTRRQLIDWYTNSNGPDTITVRQLMEEAKTRGVQII